MRVRKTLEAQGGPFRRVLPTLQTSLTLPELPCAATAILVCENVSRFFGGGCRTGKFFVGLGGRILSRCAASRVIGEGKAFRMLIVMWEPRSRLPAPLRGSTQRRRRLL